jgi:protein-disulfide isomerase
LATAISASTGVSAEILQQAMAGPDGAAMIAADAKAAKGLGLTGLPAIYVDGKLVREWKVSGKSVLAEMLASE